MSCLYGVLTKLRLAKEHRAQTVVTGPSGGSDVTFNEVTYSVKASAIFAGSFMCSSLTLIAIGALEGGLCMF